MKIHKGCVALMPTSACSQLVNLDRLFFESRVPDKGVPTRIRMIVCYCRVYIGSLNLGKLP